MISSYFMHIYARKIKDITVFTKIICNLVHIFGIAQYCQLLKVPNTPGQVLCENSFTSLYRIIFLSSLSPSRSSYSHAHDVSIKSFP